jgi:hypothetical protein
MFGDVDANAIARDRDARLRRSDGDDAEVRRARAGRQLDGMRMPGIGVLIRVASNRRVNHRNDPAPGAKVSPRIPEDCNAADERIREARDVTGYIGCQLQCTTTGGRSGTLHGRIVGSRRRDNRAASPKHRGIVGRQGRVCGLFGGAGIGAGCECDCDCQGRDDAHRVLHVALHPGRKLASMKPLQE